MAEAKKRVTKKKEVTVSEDFLEVLGGLENLSSVSVLPEKSLIDKPKKARGPQKATGTAKENKRGSSFTENTYLSDVEIKYQDFFKKVEIGSAPDLRTVKRSVPEEKNNKFPNEIENPRTLDNFKNSLEDKEFEEPITNFNLKRFLKILLILGWLWLTVWLAYFYVNTSFTKKDLLTSVSVSAVLPTGEEPTIYKVGEKAGILESPLFKGVKVGDTVLLFKKMGKVFVYREADNRMVSIVGIDLNGAANPVTATITPIVATTTDSSTISTSTEKVATSTQKIESSKTITATTSKKIR